MFCRKKTNNKEYGRTVKRSACNYEGVKDDGKH